ncbi:hypothetical protein MBGDF03_00777, partial [Thermoplasmatales archaeon SCGC AB-540-F20]
MISFLHINELLFICYQKSVWEYLYNVGYSPLPSADGLKGFYGSDLIGKQRETKS